MGALSRHVSRRRLLGAGASLGGALLLNGALRSRTQAAPAATGPGHRAWVWRFDDDGSPEAIRSVLRQNGLGIILKTHDGSDWMGKFEGGPSIWGAAQIRPLVSYFESAGVPFHAWCVVQGHDPIREAQMASEVISAGVRTLTFDLEPAEGAQYWQAGPQEALAFGRELRRLQPSAWLSVAPDPRPWQILAVPMAEFASFSNDIAPQAYWDTFDTPANYRLFREFGAPVGPEGVTPQHLLDVTHRFLTPFGRPIRPVGQGKSSQADWQGFISRAYQLGMDSVSVWRYGTANADVWPLLHRMQPQLSQQGPAIVTSSVPFVPAAQPAGVSGQTSVYPGQMMAGTPAQAPAVEPAKLVLSNQFPSQNAKTSVFENRASGFEARRLWPGANR